MAKERAEKEWDFVHDNNGVAMVAMDAQLKFAPAAPVPPTIPELGAETREGEDGVPYTKADFVEHFGGTAEWDAAVATNPELVMIQNSDSELCWYYDDHEETERHGPFPLSFLLEWRDSEHLENDLEIYRGDGEDVSTTLLEALFDAGLDNDAWWYDDDDTDGVHTVHGPYALADIREWHEKGHFADHDLIRRGREGEGVEVSTVVA